MRKGRFATMQRPFCINGLSCNDFLSSYGLLCRSWLHPARYLKTPGERS